MHDLHALLVEAFGFLQEGASDAKSGFRNPALATSPLHPPGPPGLRTVVLRRFVQDERCVEIHTDARSPKIAALRHNPAASLHFWDPARRVQVRLDGAITPAGDEQTAAAWAALPPASRATYAVTQPPGTPIAHPEDARQTLPEQDASSFFTLLRLRFDELEYLSLAHGAHRRARFRWPGGTLAATWLVP